MSKKPIIFSPIGVIRTPYSGKADTPYQPIENDNNDFFIELDKEYCSGLENLDNFKYAYILYNTDKVPSPKSLKVSPPWTKGAITIGVFASRSPNRPNNIGLSVVEIFEIKDCTLKVSSIDAFDKTPLLDIKPYIKDLDTKNDANIGWIDSLSDREHLFLHIKGIPH